MKNINKIKNLVKNECAGHISEQCSIKNYCCNKDRACLFFEDTSNLPRCKYFEEGVLPLDEELERDYLAERNMGMSVNRKAKPKVKCKRCDRSFGKNTENGCKNPHILTEDLDKMVKKVIFDFWNNKDEVIDKIINVLDDSLEENAAKDELQKYEAEISKQEKRKENLITMRVNNEISKEDFIKQREKIDDVIENIKKQTYELQEKKVEQVNKKERLLNIKNFLGNKLQSPDGITDEIIEQFLEEITIQEDGQVIITLNSGFSFTFKKEGKEYIEVY